MGTETEGQQGNAAGPRRDRRPDRAAQRRQRLTATDAARRERFVRLGAAAAVALVAAGLVAWLALGRLADDQGGADAIPGPEGGPGVAQDVGTLVGQPAPGFTLPDADGRSYTVTPGGGRPIVLVTHMGIT